MESLTPLLLLACPIGMGLAMWLMGRGMRSQRPEPESTPRSLEQLKEEQARLAQEIEHRGSAEMAVKP